jgi:hypothetical protein
MGVCRVACAGLKELIGTLPRLEVVCGGYAFGEWEKLGQRDWSERGVGATVRAISSDDAMEG